MYVCHLLPGSLSDYPNQVVDRIADVTRESTTRIFDVCKRCPSVEKVGVDQPKKVDDSSPHPLLLPLHWANRHDSCL